MCSYFYEIWHLVQIEHANYEYGTWNWLSWSKTIDSGKFCTSNDICASFYKILHSQQMKHANYEYNTFHGLERSRDYWLRMIIGCKMRLTSRTWLIVLTPRWIVTPRLIIRTLPPVFPKMFWTVALRKTRDGCFWHYVCKTIYLCSRKVTLIIFTKKLSTSFFMEIKMLL